MDELFVGRRGSLGMALEDERGVANVSTHWIPYKEITFDSKSEKKLLNGAIGSIQSSRGAKVVKKYAQGGFTADLDDSAIGLILCALFGQTPVTTGTTNKTHTFAIKEGNTHQSLSLFVQDPNIAATFALSMLNKLEITVEPSGIVEYKAEFRSQSGDDAVVTTPDYTNVGNTILHSDTAIKIATNESGLGAATAIKITKLVLTFDKNVQDFNDLGALDSSEIVNKQFQVSAQIELGFVNADYRDLMLSEDNKAVQITFTVGANNSLAFTLPVASVMSWKPEKKLDDIAVETIEIEGHWSTSADSVKAILKNQEDYALSEESPA